MNAYKRIASFLMAMVMTFSMLPGFAMADTDEEILVEETEVTPKTYVHINPRYRGLISEAEIARNTEPAPQADADIPTVTTVAEAATIVRAAMVARQKKVSFAMEYEVYQKLTFDNFLDELMSIATAHTGVRNEGDALALQYAGSSLSMSYSGGPVNFTLSMVYYTTAAEEEALTRKLDSVMGSLNISGKDDYHKVKAIYDYICSHVTYDYANLNDPNYMLKYTAYAALKNGTAVCQGYAVLFYEMALMAGLSCRTVTGIGNGGPHAWNIVRVDGKYYNVDATWDSSYYEAYGSTDNYAYFLRCDATFDDHYPYNDYTSQSFVKAYPKASSDYVYGAPAEPDVPTLTSVSHAQNGVTVKWDAAPGAEKYKLQYKISGGSYKTAVTTSNTSYTIPADKLSSGNKYYFRVCGVSGSGTASAYSATKNLTYLATPALPTVSNTSSGVKVTWTAVPGAVNYRVMYKTESGSWKTAGTTTGTSYTVKDLTNGTKYYFTIRCVNADNTKTTSAYNTTGASITWRKTYKITFDANGGTDAPGTQTKTYGKALTLTTDVPTRKGYTFAGWATSASGDVKYQPGDSYTSNGTKTLYAKWTANRYTIKFNGNGKTSGSMTSMSSRKYGTSYTLSANAYKRTDYTFVGWNTKADGTGTAYTDGASVKNLTSKDGGTVTLYAQWKLKTYKVTFDANGGSNAPSAQTKTYGQTLTLTADKPTRKGYSFQGWADEAGSATVKYKAGADYTSNASKTLYAVWKKK